LGIGDGVFGGSCATFQEIGKRNREARLGRHASFSPETIGISPEKRGVPDVLYRLDC
jgi:hypothetical protein